MIIEYAVGKRAKHNGEKLKGRVAVIAGSRQGIGRTIAMAMAKEVAEAGKLIQRAA